VIKIMQKGIKIFKRILAEEPVREILLDTLYSKESSSTTRKAPLVKGYTCFLGTIIFVKQNYAVLMQRFHKFERILIPGINLKVPFIDKIGYMHDLREQAIEISSQVAVTKDNVALHIDGVLYIQIEDPYKASYGVESINDAITNLAQTTMRSEIGKLTLDKTFEEREYLNTNIVNAISEEIQEWGVKCLRYEIKDIEPPSNIQKSMILQAEAERKKRANILTSEGERQSQINIAEADKISKVLRAEGKTQATIKKAEASAGAIKGIGKSVDAYMGRNAANFVLAQKYIDAYQELGKTKNTLLMGTTPINVDGNITDSMQILDQIQITNGNKSQNKENKH
jgi:regulator of protease activity HflC (stomatin/prohibitin superfamily)